MVGRHHSLPCFDPTKYYLDSMQHNGGKCIAPAKHGGQCRNKIDMSTVGKLTTRFSASIDSSGQHKLVREIVLAHCCGRWHDWKLAGREDVLAEVCSRYEDSIKAAKDPASVDVDTFDTVCQDKKAHSVQAQPHRALPRRSARDLSRPDPHDSIEAYTNVFIPYSSCHFGDVKSRLITPITDRRDGHGWVYGFTCPDRPGLVKIGSCKSSPATRLLEWLECHPTAKLIHAIAVPFRKRAEQLIHRELSRQRHKMVSCRQCSRTHLEWFKVSVEKARSVMDSWEELFTRWSPYLEDGKVAPEWNQRLDRTRHDLTAKRLLGICTTEKALRRSIEREETWPKMKDEPLLVTSTPGKWTIELQGPRFVKSLIISSIDWDMVMVYYYDFWRLI